MFSGNIHRLSTKIVNFKSLNQITDLPIKQVTLRFHSKDTGDKSSSSKLPKNPEPNTPLGMLDRQPKKTEKVEVIKDSSATSDAYAPFPDGKNPVTGEVGGPIGPEPTRYGDWERKGRVTDF